MRGIALGLAVAGVVALASPPSIASPSREAQTAAPSAAPNVVLLMIDDATVADIRNMPNVQRLLVDRGTTFARNYVPMPLCCPARATVLTGRYPHNHMVLDNVPPLGGAPAFDDTNTLATYLDPAYETSMVGKYLNASADDTYIPPGWDDWRATSRGTTYNYVEQTQYVNGAFKTFTGYMPDVHGREARNFIRTVPLDQPFFSYLGWVAPHAGTPSEPYDLSTSAYVAPRYRGTYTGPRLPKDESFNESDVSDKPAFVRDLPLLTKRGITAISQRLVQRRESLMAVDNQVGRIVAEVTERGQLATTYFIFVSDNGEMQGEHRLPRNKELAYEPAAQVPLVIAGPGFAPGRRYSGVTGLQDILPTVLDITGTSLPPGAPEPDGVSLLGLVTGTVTTDRVQLIEVTETAHLTDQQVAKGVRPSVAEAERLTTGGFSWRFRGIVTDNRWKYVRHSGGEELYDLAGDPHELQNLAKRNRYQARKARLAARLAAYRNCDGAECR